ncbi:putative peptidyl-prolyl cis-trans isomerase Cbf2 precursor [Clostridium acetireducens DSM 10703]|uniref:Putative peptidyl-prolyl cis-trans isomerase Cbf2 n=1 Tax=Clostridium acetireducens DSM 10703 TaxID=1121290 RepID=A0A1E8EUG5_9CLOT|nr:peptidylprolyl isomerase [Clostridium acetireducens]OFH96890.1 putative peptidyl-prolyl cis-trans isomerase Cbf2 precursor [Clostridium acetireducens DSM 10703]
MESKVVALVNGEKITENDIQQTILRFPKERQAFLNTEEGKKQLLDQIISFELSYNYGKEIGLDKDEMYALQLERAAKEILTQMAINKILEKAEVSENEVIEYYNANKESFKNEENITAKHILTKTLEEAEKVFKEIEEGMDFEEAAKQYSMCPSKAEGGNLGTFIKGQMVPEFEKAAFELSVGRVSDPVKTQFGYHLIKVEDKEESSYKNLEEVKDFIKSNLLQKKQADKYVDFTNELKEKYHVEIK